MPLLSIADTNSAYKQPLIQLSRFSTPHRPRKNERKAFSALDFEDVHRSIAQSQYEYIGWPRKNSVRVRGPWFQALAPCEAHLLCAANIEARLRFSKIAVHEALRHLETYDGPVCFFSVCPRHHVVPLHRAHFVDLRRLKKLTGQVFADCSLFGAIDFALFKGFGKHRIRTWHNHVGAHTHGLVWGKSEPELLARISAMGPDFINVKGEPAAYVGKVNRDEFAGYIRYSLKIPLFEYNVTASEQEVVDPETGEILRSTKVSSNPLRPGDQLRMSALLSEMYLDEIIFGQHEGTVVVREVRRRARESLVHMNRLNVRRGGSPSAHISIGVDDSPWSRTAVAKLLRDPPKKTWLGRRLAPQSVESLLNGHRMLTAGKAPGAESSLSELVFN